MILANPLIEPLPDARHSGLRIKSFRKACVDFHWHFHPEIELVHVKHGSGVRYVGRSVEPFESGDFCLIGANVPHAFGSSPSERCGAEWTVCHFRPEVWGEAFWRLPEIGKIAGLLSRAQRGIRFMPRDASKCEELLQRIEHSPAGATRLAAWLEMLGSLARARQPQYLNPVSQIEVEVDVRLQKVLAWIEEHANEPEMSQASAAEAAHLSPQAFCRFFRTGTGRTFRRYVSEVRVAQVCGALVRGEAQISEIAFEAGFNNLANFNRRFREITGRTPLEYRKMIGGLSV